MKFYFAGSIRGGRENTNIYQLLIKFLSNYGHVLTEHVGDLSLSRKGQYKLSDIYIFNQDMNWLKSSDVVIAEVTTPSLGVGYELKTAEILKKPTIVLYSSYNKAPLSAMISGDKYFKCFIYKDFSEAKKILTKELKLK